VSVSACNQPVVSDRVKKSGHILHRVGGVGFEEVNDVADAGAALVLIFACRGNAERLAHVLLMDAPQAGGRADAVEALDDNGDLILKVYDSGIYDRESEGPPQL
jgi:hypothetical protein